MVFWTAGILFQVIVLLWKLLGKINRIRVLSASFTAMKYVILRSDVILMVDVAEIGRHCESWLVVLGQATLLVVLKKDLQ